MQSRFRLRLGPLTYAQFEEFLPDPRPTAARKSFYLLAQLVRVFVGSEYDFDVQLALAAGEVPEAHLSQPHEAAAGPRLGWNLWLVSAPPAPAAPDAPDADDAAFEADWVTAATPDSP